MKTSWSLDPQVTFLNHGSYGACPRAVLEVQDEWRARMERQPVAFFEQLETHLDEARGALAQLLGAQPDDLAFVANATTGVNTVLRALDLGPGDEILTTDHEYNAVRNTIDETCRRAGARPVVASLPLPVDDATHPRDAFLERVTARTRLAVISHVTSPTALILPIPEIVSALTERGVDALVDGAHAPGMVPLDLDELGAAYYAGNCHKWLCAPKGSGFLHVRRDRQPTVRPLVVSHGANSPRRDRSRFRLEFDWTGTPDPTPFLALPAAIELVGGLLPGGWASVMEANRRLALGARERLLAVLGAPPLAPPGMIGSMAAVELPADLAPRPLDPPPGASHGATYPPDSLHAVLLREHAIEVPVYPWPHAPGAGAERRRLLRVSAQLYNSAADYERLAAVLAGLLGRGVEPGGPQSSDGRAATGRPA